MNIEAVQEFVDARWDSSAVPELVDYIKIPNKSPLFDPDWEKHGYMEQAVQQFTAWCEQQGIQGMALDVVRLPGRTPLIYMDIPGGSDGTVLLYGHLDKQPEMSGWREGLGPWQPVLEGDKLYGRGGADDGYATFASLIAIKALQEQNTPHARCVVIIEACEESGSIDLPHYIDALANRIGDPDLVICLDSGCGNYQQLWCTTSLRGLIGGELRVRVLEEGVHSGDASGIVPSSFRLLRLLLARIEDAVDGRVTAPEFHVDIPQARRQQAQLAAKVLGDEVWTKFPFAAGMRPVDMDPAELILNRTWRPALVVTDAPSASTASMVQLFTDRPSTWIVQAPHWLVSQPICVPVSASDSRSQVDSSRSGSTSPATGFPFTVTVIFIRPPPPLRIVAAALASNRRFCRPTARASGPCATTRPRLGQAKADRGNRRLPRHRRRNRRRPRLPAAAAPPSP